MFKLQLIVDTYRPLPDLQSLFEAGVDCLQVRIRDESSVRLLKYVESVVQLAKATGALTLVNGRVDIAMAAAADGVQAGSRGISPAEVRALAPDFLVGASVHSLDEAKRAENDGAGFVTFGHVFPSASHPGESPRGLEALCSVVSGIGIPVVAIGGINSGNVNSVAAAGAAGVAVIGAIWNVDPDKRRAIARQLLEGINQ